MFGVGGEVTVTIGRDGLELRGLVVAEAERRERGQSEGRSGDQDQQQEATSRKRSHRDSAGRGGTHFEIAEMLPTAWRAAESLLCTICTLDNSRPPNERSRAAPL